MLVETMLDNGGSKIVDTSIKDRIRPKHLGVVSGRHIVQPVYDYTRGKLATFLSSGGIGNEAFLTGGGSQGIVSNDFRDAYAKWVSGSFSRKGSLTKLPSAVDRLVILHIFGATILDLEHETHEGILPYVLMAVGRPGHPLLVASFYDAGRKWEDEVVYSAWAHSEVASTPEVLPVRAALAAALYSIELSPLVSSEEQEQRLMDSIAYAAGVRHFTDDEGVSRFKSR